jgi:hypothetical protein
VEPSKLLQSRHKNPYLRGVATDIVTFSIPSDGVHFLNSTIPYFIYTFMAGQFTAVASRIAYETRVFSSPKLMFQLNINIHPLDVYLTVKNDDDDIKETVKTINKTQTGTHSY